MTKALSRGLILAVGFTFFATIGQAQQFASYVMDARTGQVIQAVNADTRLYPASLTKMMTLYIVFDQIKQGRMSLDQKITISANAAAEPPSHLGLKPGQKIELRYLIRAAAIKSANDAATAMGEAVGGSEAGFAAIMNRYARAMGLRNTTFQNANGLTREGHKSSAHDMAEIGRRLYYDFPQFYNIFSREATSAGLKTVKNTNRRLLDAYPGADGIKTGYTVAAGFNLVSSAQRGDKRVIVAVMGAKSSAQRNAEVARLMDLGFARMPQEARVVMPAPLHATAVATAKPAEQPVVQQPAETVALASPPATRGSTASVGSLVATAVSVPTAIAAPDGSIRPMPRQISADAEITRNSQSIAAAVAEVNSELAAARADAKAAIEAGRPVPRPAPAMLAEATAAAPSAGSASTFAAVAPAPARAAEAAPITVANAGSGTTGGNDWGVQIGAFRSRGDAERQLLTTALQDVPELAGGLRRVEAAKVQGVTVFRAQFVGLNQQAAIGACESLMQRKSDCMPLAPGI